MSSERDDSAWDAHRRAIDDARRAAKDWRTELAEVVDFWLSLGGTVHAHLLGQPGPIQIIEAYATSPTYLELMGAEGSVWYVSDPASVVIQGRGLEGDSQGLPLPR